MLLIVLQALLVGFFASVGLGPVTVFVLKRGISKGFKSAFISGLGSSIVDTVYGTIAFIGAGFVMHWVSSNQEYIRLVITAILLIIAYFLWTRRPADQVLGLSAGGENPMTDFLTTFGLSASNPLLIFVFLTVFSLVPFTEDYLPMQIWPWVTVGLFLGTGLWWMVLSRAICLFRHRLPALLYRYLNRIAAFILVFLALYSGISGLSRLLGAG